MGDLGGSGRTLPLVLAIMAILAHSVFTQPIIDSNSQLIVPVVHRGSFVPLRSSSMTTMESGRKQSLTAGRPPPENGTKGPLRSQLITLNEPFGQYFAVMELGSPAAEIALIIDTGSDIMWVQCQPCRKCGSQIRDPIFDPSKSHSYRELKCSSVWCKDATGLAMGCRHPFSAPTKSDTCFYNATYGDNSVSYGELSVDTLTVPSLNGNPIAVSDFVFGCGLENTGVETDFNASGLMGLDRGSHSIVTQLGVQSFAYCLPDRTHNIDTATGFISFGNEQLRPSAARQQQIDVDVRQSLQYTTLLLNNKTEYYAQSYYVNLTGISVGRQILDIPSSLFDIDEFSGYGGTIIDTGTSLTSLVDLAYAVFRDSVRSQVSGSAREIYIPELPSFDTCYTMPRAEGAPAVAEIRLHFEGRRLELRLPETNVWLQVGTGGGDRNVYCLAFASAGEGAGGRNVIGNFQQQDFLVEYDLQRGRIGFAHLLQCSAAAGSRQLRPFGWLITLLFLPLLVFFLLFCACFSAHGNSFPYRLRL